MDSRPWQWILTIEEPGEPSREVIVPRREVRIGRSGQAHVRLGDPSVARQHAFLERTDDGGLRVCDLESGSGTRVNGVRISQAPLRPGDEVRVGDTVIRVDVQDAAVVQGFLPPGAGGPGHKGLEVAVLWGDRVMQAAQFPPGRPVRAGVGPACAVLLPPEALGAETVDWAWPDGTGFVVDVSGPGVSGEVLRDGRVRPLRDAAPGGQLRLDDEARARLRVGGFTVLLGLSALPPRFAGSWWTRFSVRDHLFLMASLVLHLLFLVLVALVPEDQLQAARDPYDREMATYRKVEISIRDPEARKALAMEQARQEQAARKALDDARGTLEVAAPTPGPRLDGTGRRPPSILDVRDPEAGRRRALTALDRIFGNRDLGGGDAAGPGAGPGTRLALGPGGTDPSLLPGGPGGLELPGGFRAPPGAGPGGPVYDPLPAGRVDGLPRVRLHSVGEPQATASRGEVEGTGLDRELVRNQVLNRMAEVRWCYQQEVQSHPDLEGDVRAEWTILPTGRVAGVRVAGGRLADSQVARCLSQRIAAWTFPMPRDGGVVKVSYPFLFRVLRAGGN